ncbi:MAG: hypothetical protein BIP78_0648 [Candidatus Bipolaricaulis sibiricus]|uniref:Right handed beta helix domain-containing protein n=1 Tax=Bipolaricaulis sibiricus TaxID=2501609 RepID=A0A410FTT8_BIPS1|nr:MAG: hypothetical protein BIP78_0648 [Candidatus Bipolaricaulis sibiricus]
MVGTRLCSVALRWTAITALFPLLLSCARQAPPQTVPCTITVRPGASIQAALDEAPPGAIVCLPAGTWTESLRVAKPLTLRGAGPTRTILRGSELGHPVVSIGPHVEGTVVLVGITFTNATGACSEPAGCAHGLLVLGEAVVEVEQCAFSGNTACGVAVRDEARVELRNSSITANTGYGLYLQGRAQATLTAVTLSGNRSTGIWLADQARLTLAGSTVTRCEGHGLWIRDQSRLFATDSTVSACAGHGLWVRDQAMAELTRCTISGHRDTGVWIEHAAQVILTGCTIHQTWDGVEARDSSRLQIMECTISAIRWNGVKVQSYAVATIRNSRVFDCRGSGIYLAGAAQAEITDNRIEACAAQGILSLSRTPPSGNANVLRENGVDLAGNLSDSLRVPLVPPSQEDVRFPNPAYTTLQEAADAVQPGGRLVLTEGIYAAGVTLGKKIRVEADGVVLLTARSAHESAVISLVGGADVDLRGTALGRGSEGLIMGNDARARLTDCVVSDNLRGVHAQDSAVVELLRCRVSRNEQGGVWLWGQARGVVEDCAFTQNGVCGIGIGGTATASITASQIKESGWNGGVVLRDAAQAQLWGNSFLGNYGAGVAVFHGLCIGSGYVFFGRVVGGENVFEGNYKGRVCPEELSFLWGPGGEFDFRR